MRMITLCLALLIINFAGKHYKTKNKSNSSNASQLLMMAQCSTQNMGAESQVVVLWNDDQTPLATQASQQYSHSFQQAFETFPQIIIGLKDLQYLRSALVDNFLSLNFQYRQTIQSQIAISYSQKKGKIYKFSIIVLAIEGYYNKIYAFDGPLLKLGGQNLTAIEKIKLDRNKMNLSDIHYQNSLISSLNYIEIVSQGHFGFNQKLQWIDWVSQCQQCYIQLNLTAQQQSQYQSAVLGYMVMVVNTQKTGMLNQRGFVTRQINRNIDQSQTSIQFIQDIQSYVYWYGLLDFDSSSEGSWHFGWQLTKNHTFNSLYNIGYQMFQPEMQFMKNIKYNSLIILPGCKYTKKSYYYSNCYLTCPDQSCSKGDKSYSRIDCERKAVQYGNQSVFQPPDDGLVIGLPIGITVGFFIISFICFKLCKRHDQKMIIQFIKKQKQRKKKIKQKQMIQRQQNNVSQQQPIQTQTNLVHTHHNQHNNPRESAPPRNPASNPVNPDN